MLKDKKIKDVPKQADFTLFALDLQGTHAPFAPPGYAGDGGGGGIKGKQEIIFQERIEGNGKILEGEHEIIYKG